MALSSQVVTDPGVEWTRFLLDAGASIEQSREMGRAEARDGRKCFYLLVRDGRDLVAGARVSASRRALGQHALDSTDGPVAASRLAEDVALRRAAVVALREPARELGRRLRATILRVDLGVATTVTGQDLAAAGLRPQPQQGDRAVCLVELPPDEDGLWAGLRAQTRRDVRRAQREGVVIGEGDVSAFSDMLLATAGRQGFVAPGPDFMHELHQGLVAQADFGRLLLAYHDGVAVAGALVTHFGDRATYLYGASTPAGQAVKASHLLQWEALRWTQRRGARSYNMTQVAPTDDRSHPMAGLRHFKLSFGGGIVPLPPTHELVLAPVRQRVARAVRGLRP